MKTKINNILIISCLMVFIGLLILIYYFTNCNKIQELKGTIVEVDTSYVIIKTSNDEYLIPNVKGEYQKGDIIKVSYQKENLNSNISPKVIKITNDELLKEKEINKKDSDSIKETIDADTTILTYFNDLKDEVDSEVVKESVKESLIIIIDFLFYDSQIKGYSFKDLSDSAKLKVLSLSLYIDEKIEEKFPNYKESISSTTNKVYTNISTLVISTYLNLTTEICQNNDELCFTAKKTFTSLKDNFKISWDLIKETAQDSLINLKFWYEIWSGK